MENYLWVYEVLDGQWEAGDSVDGGGTPSTSLSVFLLSTNQYGVKLDSFIGETGVDYEYTQSGSDPTACATDVPATGEIGMLFMSLLLVVALTGYVAFRIRS